MHHASPPVRLRRYHHHRRKLNTSPATLDDKEALKKMLTNPPVKKIDLHFPLGLEVTARNMKGVTIKDALDAIHKQFKKKVTFSTSTFASCFPHFHLAVSKSSIKTPSCILPRLSLLADNSTGRRRARKPDPGRFRMGQGGVVDATHCASEEGGRTGLQEEEQEGRG